MIRLILSLILITLVACASAWLAENQGSVTMYWLDWRIDTSVGFLIAAASAFALAVMLALSFFKRLLLAPRIFVKHARERNYDKGLQAVTEGMAALTMSDLPLAIEQSRKAQKYLGGMPIALLMNAQIARLQGNETQMRTLLEQMLNHDETRFMASRALAEHEISHGSLTRAVEYAQAAVKIEPKDKQAATLQFGLHLRLKQYQDAQALAVRATRKRALSRAESRRMVALALWHEANALYESGDATRALPLARNAHKLSPDSAPLIQLLARCYWRSGDDEAAFQLLRSAWKRTAHPLLMDAFFEIYAELKGDELMKRAQKLAAVNKDQPASIELLARAAAKARQWATARSNANSLLKLNETQGLCRLMSEIEHGEYGDFDAAHQWLTRSNTAAKDAGWHCKHCGHEPLAWSAICPECGSVDMLEWESAHAPHEPVVEFAIPPVHQYTPG